MTRFFGPLAALFLALSLCPLRAQEDTEPQNSGDFWFQDDSGNGDEPWDAGDAEDPGGSWGYEPPPPREYRDLPRTYRDLALGMGLEDLKEALRGDAVFQFRGDRDVSFLPSRGESLVETTGPSFIRRAFFQLWEGSLFVMAFNLDTRLVDHYSIFRAFVEKYGEPVLLDPRQAVWESEDTRIAIERPLTVKYIDKTLFNDILNEARVRESEAVRLREEFINGF